MSNRITISDLRRLAIELTHAARRHGLISPTDRVRVGSAYGGTRLEITGDWDRLAAIYGEGRDNWPAGWSGVRFGFLPESGYDTKRMTYERGYAALRTLWATLDR